MIYLIVSKRKKLKQIPQETKTDIIKVNHVIQWLKKISLKLFIYNIEHKSNYIYLLLYFLCWNFLEKIVWNFDQLSGISGKYFCTLILLPYLKNSIYSLPKDNSNASPITVWMKEQLSIFVISTQKWSNNLI